MKRGRLSKRERRVLREAAGFMLAGEWPTEARDAKEDKELDRDRAALESALEKLQETE